MITVFSKSWLTVAFLLTAAISLLCTGLGFIPAFQAHQSRMSAAVALDLLVSAPQVWFLAIRKMVLLTFLFLFFIETAALHFLLQLWNKTAAWVLIGLSVYSCLQFWAHIRALKRRPVLLTNHSLFLRNGLLGGDAIIHLANIEKLTKSNKPVKGEDAVKIALLNGFEKHTVVLHLKEPVTVVRAFGITQKAKVVLASIDKAEDFVAAVEKNRSHMQDTAEM